MGTMPEVTQGVEVDSSIKILEDDKKINQLKKLDLKIFTV